jgi:hypothetical protein
MSSDIARLLAGYGGSLPVLWSSGREEGRGKRPSEWVLQEQEILWGESGCGKGSRRLTVLFGL